MTGDATTIGQYSEHSGMLGYALSSGTSLHSKWCADFSSFQNSFVNNCLIFLTLFWHFLHFCCSLKSLHSLKLVSDTQSHAMALPWESFSHIWITWFVDTVMSKSNFWIKGINSFMVSSWSCLKCSDITLSLQLPVTTSLLLLYILSFI